MPREGGTILLATSPGSLVRLTFLLNLHSRKDFAAPAAVHLLLRTS